MNWLPHKPGWLMFHESDGSADNGTGITARAHCEYHGAADQQCPNEPTHVATWPSESHNPMSQFLCPSHLASVARVSGCRVETIEREA